MLLLMLAILLSFKLHCSTVCLTIHFLKRLKPVRKGDLVLAPDSLKAESLPVRSLRSHKLYVNSYIGILYLTFKCNIYLIFTV